MSRYHRATRLATGEMSHVDPDEWPIHKEVADALGGELRPFDQYQGPYIAWEGKQIFIGPPMSMWMALILGEGWTDGFADKEEATRQAQEGLDEHGVKMNVDNLVQPDSAEGYLVATDTRSGDSTSPYPRHTGVAADLVSAIRELAGSPSAPTPQ